MCWGNNSNQVNLHPTTVERLQCNPGTPCHHSVAQLGRASTWKELKVAGSIPAGVLWCLSVAVHHALREREKRVVGQKRELAHYLRSQRANLPESSRVHPANQTPYSKESSVHESVQTSNPPDVSSGAPSNMVSTGWVEAQTLLAGKVEGYYGIPLPGRCAQNYATEHYGPESQVKTLHLPLL